MRRRFAYDQSHTPPAPVLPLLLAAPGNAESVLLPGLVDTGADCTLVPESVAQRLHLPEIDRVVIEGVGGTSHRAAVHAASVRLAGHQWLARLVALGQDAIIGRDLLNRIVATLDGPLLVLRIGSRAG